MQRNLSWRSAVAVVAFALILAGGFETNYLTIFFTDRTALAEKVGHLRFGKLPEIRPFLEAVKERTEPGQKIALVIPSARWNEGYEYAFYRAAYVLAGRTVLPVITPDNRMIEGNFERADLIAAWGVEPNPGRFTVEWRGEGGSLARPFR